MANFFDSGMRFEFKKSNSKVAYCALTTSVGTRNEEKGEGGLAHFTEHLFFKGTEFRSAKRINNSIENLGGELNAYTTKEETVLHCTVLKEDLRKAIELLFEIAFCSIFPEKELEKEKVVILEEINSYKDSPSEQIFDDFEELLFKGTPLSMPILGKVASVKKINREKLVKYYKKHFIPSNMCFTVVADSNEAAVKHLVSTYFNKYVADGIVCKELPLKKDVIYNYFGNCFSKDVSKRNHQCHCLVGALAYSYYNQKRIPLILLVNILGGPSTNSKLNMALREKNALVYSVDASYNQYSDVGALTIYFGCDNGNYEKCLRLVYEQLKLVREKRISSQALAIAKKQFLGQIAISSDNGESQCLNMGKSLMVFGRVMPMEEIEQLVMAITPEQLQEVAQDILAEDKLSRLTYL